MQKKSYFFCGIGGSGMLPLAILLHKRGHNVCGSDRSYDQGKTPDKFKKLIKAGISLYPQDGSGVVNNTDFLVVSSAVEDTILDVKKSKEFSVPIIKRGTLLAEFFNGAKNRIAIAGTSGKSTVTGMVGTILTEMGFDPTVVNGGLIRNFFETDDALFSSVRVGSDDYFVAEMDESDGSIAHYNPSVSALNNIALDHMSMEELEKLFSDYVCRTENVVVANIDDSYVQKICASHVQKERISISLFEGNDAQLVAQSVTPHKTGIDFTLEVEGYKRRVQLNVPGRHNVYNALCALGICQALSLDMDKVCEALSRFKGIHRRMEYIGCRKGITVYDDFGHNPDKISASLQTLKEFDGRLIVMFQPHGFGPLRLMGREMIDSFKQHMNADDILLMPEVYYAGGNVDRSVTAKDIIETAKKSGVNACWFESRNDIASYLHENAQEGDRIVIMGARDDTLHEFACKVLEDA